MHHWPAVCVSGSVLMKICCTSPSLIALWSLLHVTELHSSESVRERATTILLICFLILGPSKPFWSVLLALTNTLAWASFLFFIPRNIFFLQRYVVLLTELRLALSLCMGDLWVLEWKFSQYMTQTTDFLKRCLKHCSMTKGCSSSVLFYLTFSICFTDILSLWMVQTAACRSPCFPISPRSSTYQSLQPHLPCSAFICTALLSSLSFILLFLIFLIIPSLYLSGCHLYVYR